jgi:hypothetical protein
LGFTTILDKTTSNNNNNNNNIFRSLLSVELEAMADLQIARTAQLVHSSGFILFIINIIIRIVERLSILATIATPCAQYILLSGHSSR